MDFVWKATKTIKKPTFVDHWRIKSNIGMIHTSQLGQLELADSAYLGFVLFLGWVISVYFDLPWMNITNDGLIHEYGSSPSITWHHEAPHQRKARLFFVSKHAHVHRGMKKDEESLHPKKRTHRMETRCWFPRSVILIQIWCSVLHSGGNHPPTGKAECTKLFRSQWRRTNWTREEPAVFKRRVKSQIRNGEAPTS